MSKVSKIVTTTLNRLLSPLKTLNFTLFQNPKKPTIKPPKNGLLENNNNKLQFLQVQKMNFFFKESIFEK
jgi:hypothetical protein